VDPRLFVGRPLPDRKEHSMSVDLLELYSRASQWTNEKVAHAVADLDARTPCDEWNVRRLLNHMLDTQRYFLSSARGEDAPPPAPSPPQVLSADPLRDFNRARTEMLDAFSEPGIIEKTGRRRLPDDPRPLHRRATQRRVQTRDPGR
jgi:uncharacterized damage-inducible protein DinB